MHAHSLWWKLLAGKHRASSQAKTKTRKKAGPVRATDPPSIQSAEDHGPRKTPTRAVAAPPAEDVNGFGSLLGAMGPRRLRAMTSRSRVGGSKYKVNNQNLEKFEVILAKIPEGEKVAKPVLSVTSLPERHEDITRLTATTVAERVERVVPDIGPSLTMGSSVTAEYELFCKEFHSEAKHLLPDEHQQNVCSNPMRQLLQSASEAAAKGLQLQRVTAAAGVSLPVSDGSAVKPESMLPEKYAALLSQPVSTVT